VILDLSRQPDDGLLEIRICRQRRQYTTDVAVLEILFSWPGTSHQRKVPRQDRSAIYSTYAKFGLIPNQVG
jgi:hypothetical protein